MAMMGGPQKVEATSLAFGSSAPTTTNKLARHAPANKSGKPPKSVQLAASSTNGRGGLASDLPMSKSMGATASVASLQASLRTFLRTHCLKLSR
jgi:hypothetical protein